MMVMHAEHPNRRSSFPRFEVGASPNADSLPASSFHFPPISALVYADCLPSRPFPLSANPPCSPSFFEGDLSLFLITKLWPARLCPVCIFVCESSSFNFVRGWLILGVSPPLFGTSLRADFLIWVFPTVKQDFFHYGAGAYSATDVCNPGGPPPVPFNLAWRVPDLRGSGTGLRAEALLPLRLRAELIPSPCLLFVLAACMSCL